MLLIITSTDEVLFRIINIDDLHIKFLAVLSHTAAVWLSQKLATRRSFLTLILHPIHQNVQ